MAGHVPVGTRSNDADVPEGTLRNPEGRFVALVSSWGTLESFIPSSVHCFNRVGGPLGFPQSQSVAVAV